MFRKAQHLLVNVNNLLAKALIISGLALSAFCLTTAEAGISETITYSTSYANDFIPLPAGLSITVNISHSASGVITVTGPDGFSATRNLSCMGSSNSGILLGAAGTYTVNESYNLTVTGTASLLDPVRQSYSASATPWTFEVIEPGSTAEFEVSSSLSDLFISGHSDNVKANISGTSAAITTAEEIDIGESVSTSAQGTWVVSAAISITEPPSTGTINVTTNLNSASFSISGSASYSGSGTSWMKTDAPVGDYTIRYSNVDGYFTPATQTATLDENETIGFDGTYVEAPTGTIKVATNLNSARFRIIGPANYNGTGTSWTKKIAPVGDYTIVYGDVAGYTKPASQTATLSEGEEISFSGTYIDIPTGIINVATNLGTASFSITGPVRYNGSGVSWTQMSAPLGEYTITYNAAPGYSSPPSQTDALLDDGDTINFSGAYMEVLSGIINVTTNLVQASFSITGPVDYSGSGNSWMRRDAPPGEYTITYDTVPGYVVPEPQTAVLSSDETINFNGVYRGTGILEVNTNLEAAAFHLSGPADYSGSGTSWIQTGVVVGTYTITYDDINGYQKPPSETRTLVNGTRITFTGNYIALNGTISVFTNLDSAFFDITGPIDYSGGGKTWTQTDAPMGEYTITYGDVPGYETPASETITLVRDSVISFYCEYIPILPVISSVTVSGTPAKAGNTIAILAVGDPGLDAAFSIGDIATDIPMTEDELNSGVYTGEYIVQEGDNIEDAVVNVTFSGLAGLTTLNEDKRATIDTEPPVIDSVTVSGSPVRTRGDVITVMLMGEPGGIAVFRVGNVSQELSMTESAEQPGTYTGTYTAKEGANVSGAKVFVSLSDALGNTSVDESQIASICIIPWDINKDGIVDALDIQAVASNLGKADAPEMDFNDDGVIDMLDVLIVAKHYGEICGFEGNLPVAAPMASCAVLNYVFQNYPNPCNPETWIPFMLAEGQEVVVSIYNTSGQLVRRLDLGYKNPGVYVSREGGAYWDGRNEYDEEVASGVYFYYIKAGEFSAVRKMLVAR